MPYEGKLYLFPLVLLLSSGLSAQSIDSTSLPALWLRADKAAITDTSWIDFSGNKHSAVYSNKSGSKKYNLLNYNPAVSFAGAADSMKVAYSLDTMPSFTVIAVFQTAAAGESGVWGTANPLAHNSMMTTRRVAGPDSIPADIGVNEQSAVLSTVTQSWPRAAKTNPSAYMTLGSTGSQTGYASFNGAIAELLVFPQKLDLLTQIQYETYLAIKYGIPLTRGNYVSAGENVLWDADQNKDYGYRIAGLGREPFFGLHQKQGRSALDKDSLLIFSVGRLVAMNKANPDSLHNGDYLVWGDNNKDLSTVKSDDSLLDVLGRKWLMSVTGDSAARLKTSVRLNLKHLPTAPLGYWLVSDPSGQNNFSSDNLNYVLPDSLSGDSVVFYRSVQWDADRSGKDGFGFAQAKDLFAKITVLDSPACDHRATGRAAAQIVSGGKGPFGYQLYSYTDQSMSSGTIPDSSRVAEIRNLAMGKYLVRVSDPAGHQYSRTFTLTAPNQLSLNLGPDQTLTPGGEIVLDASQNIPAGLSVQYQWTGTSGFSSTNAVVTVKDAGVYTVTATNPQGCAFRDSINIYGPGSQRFDVYPSPVTDGNYSVSVSLPQKSDVTIFVYDLAGHQQDMILGKDNSSYQFHRHISAPGVYFIKIVTDNGSETKKILVL